MFCVCGHPSLSPGLKSHVDVMQDLEQPAERVPAGLPCMVTAELTATSPSQVRLCLHEWLCSPPERLGKHMHASQRRQNGMHAWMVCKMHRPLSPAQ